MAASIWEERIREEMRPWIGALLADGTPIAARCEAVLRAYVPRETSLEETAAALEQVIFAELYAALGRGMRAPMGDGSVRRIRTDTLPEIADAALGVLLEKLAVNPVSDSLLRTYAMTTGSCSALRVLYQRFAAYQTAEERALLARLLAERYPPNARPAWLKMPE